MNKQEINMTEREALINRLFNKVDLFRGITDEDCWLWTGCVDNKGYGQIRIKGKNKAVHRVVYGLYKEDPGYLLALHKCDSRRCVNPSHIFLGDEKDNTQDMLNKGRQATGSDYSHCSITTEEVAEIRKLYSGGLYSQYELARKFNCNQSQISLIVNYKQRKIK